MPDGTSEWNQIVEEHAKHVFRVAVRILGTIHDAEDLSQDVFTEAFRLHRSGKVEAWPGLLIRMATLRSIDRLRRRRPALQLREEDRVSNIDPSDKLSDAELTEQLRTLIAQLPDQQATVFTMVHFEQMSRNEVSAALGISPEAVSTALYKARERLFERLSISNRGDLS